LNGRWLAVFDTYLGKDFEKAVKKMEKRINEKVPGLKQIALGLSIKVQRMTGPLVEGELSKCKDFVNKITNQIKPRLPTFNYARIFSVYCRLYLVWWLI